MSPRGVPTTTSKIDEALSARSSQRGGGMFTHRESTDTVVVQSMSSSKKHNFISSIDDSTGSVRK